MSKGKNFNKKRSRNQYRSREIKISPQQSNEIFSIFAGMFMAQTIIKAVSDGEEIEIKIGKSDDPSPTPPDDAPDPILD